MLLTYVSPFNLAPADERKSGAGLDLAIAIGLLIADEQLSPADVELFGFVGELGLDGSLRAVAGAVPLVAALHDLHPVVPASSHREAVVVSQRRVFPVRTLREVVEAMRGDEPWPPPPIDDSIGEVVVLADLADVRGQALARQALEIAAAGGHHALFVGPPGSGKTMLAQRMPGLLPALTPEESLQVTMIHSAGGATLPPGGLITWAPYRAPHHTITEIGLVGGGTAGLRPGEITLAHRGTLFLDELGEFKATVLDGLRQPLEEGVVRISRAHASATMPAKFLLLAATNPCPCGGGAPGRCRCDDRMRNRYLARLSGPLLDRFDLRVPVHRPEIDELLVGHPGEPSAVVARRVQRARDVAMLRQGCLDSEIPSALLDAVAPLTPAARTLLRAELERDRMTGRGYHRVRRVARTLADLDPSGAELIEDVHVAMALQFRVQMSVHLDGRAA